MSAFGIVVPPPMGVAPPAPNVAPVRFKFGGKLFTPADPCMFRDHCTESEWLIWARVASKWIDAAGRAARTDAERFQVNVLAQSWVTLEGDGRECSIADCREYVKVFAHLAERARNLIVAWGGSGPDENVIFDIVTEAAGDLIPDVVKPAIPWALLLGFLALAYFLGGKR